MRYMVSYYNNGTEDTAKIKRDKISQKRFISIENAIEWIKTNTQINPIKLLEWDDEIDSYRTIKAY